MIPGSQTRLHPNDWQRQLAQALDDPRELVEALRLPGSLLVPAQRAAKRFPLRVTRYFLSLMEVGNPDDPLLRQVLPIREEEDVVEGYCDDPVGDRQAALGAGVLQKYRGRALLITTGACAIHCRYCFRRNYPYAEDNAVRHWRATLHTLRANPEINEAILSGGDPLSLSDTRLAELLDALQSMSHLRRLRVHTRLPVVLPDRVTPRLCAMLSENRLKTALVLHCNHANELAEPLSQALENLHRAGVALLNQSVLLRGVNDTTDSLARLSEQLFDCGILPYYLHLLDPVQGAAHFDVPLVEAQRMMCDLRERLPGYLVPRLVREIPGEPSKTPMDRR